MTRDKAKEEIIRLAERFRENLDVYKKGTYNETQLRREFVDPFFEALGWDVTNKSGHAEQYKDVVHEDAVKIGVTTKAPDYSFRVGGQRKFFLETKKPAINIKDDVSPAYQIRRYAWNANLPISILTDFEELAVYDCGIKPGANDKVSMGRVALYHFEDYVKKFDEIYDTFSKEAVWKGAFDRYAGESKKARKGAETVGKEFLKEIERWRELLAKNIAVNNSKLDVYELNFSVQQTIDRIVFLRICEDRGMENYGQLQGLLNGTNVYKRLFDVFYKADQKYNSGLFDFSEDKLTNSLSIDDKVLKDIIENLYYPKSPYEFAVFDAEILGNVYEQFLGKVIRLTPSHQAKVEEKPEVKKAGGVYYTPRYIVDYIVANTVGKLLGDISGDSESPSPLEGAIPSPMLRRGRSRGIEGGNSPSPLEGEGRGEGGNSPSPLEGEGRGEGLNSYNPRLIQLARNLRKNQTDAEKLMWLLVRNNQLGAKFRRQQPIGKYIADFYCSEKKLAIELDGGKHTESKDRPKTEFLNQAGMTVLRFWNSEVLENTEGVLQAIWNKINTPHLNPLPQGERKIFKITPKQVEKIKILDPACGSGSFLLGAYRFLLEWHLTWYTENNPIEHAKGKRPAIYKAGQDSWRLTTQEKKKILLNNIYGVDIDRQAVEVTKLSLLLKVLEGENEETLGKSLALFRERALPNLESNVKCGNSLIGPDFYSQGALSFSPSPLEGEGRVREKNLGYEEARRINVFDWNDDKKGFGGIMKEGGFDCVIGNPPWGADFSVLEQGYFRILYNVAKGSNIDSYAVFIENSLNRLKTDGLLGYITPDTFLRKDDHQSVREFLLKNNHIMEMVETGPVFSKVRDTWCLVITIAKTKPETKSIILHKKLSRFIVSAEDRLSKFGGADWDIETKILQSVWQKRPKMIIGYLASKVEQQLIAKIESHPALGQLMNKYRISRGEEGSKFALEKTSNGEFFIFIPENIERYTIDEGLRITAEELTPNKLKSFYKHPKIWIIRIQKMRWKQRIVCSLDDRRNSAGMKTLQVIVSLADNLNELKYLQGILASSLINFWCVNYLADDMNQSYLEKLPIRAIDFKNKTDKSLHDKMVAFVDNMLELNRKLKDTKTPHDRELIERRIKATDNQIDRLVYELYALTEEEIKVVEGE